MARIAIFSVNDYVWAFPTWSKTIPKLVDQGHDVVGIYLFPEKLGNLKGLDAKLWYPRTFGFMNTCIMACYAAQARIKQIAEGNVRWKALATRYSLQLVDGTTPNAEEVWHWVKANDIDVIFIMVNHILKGTILESPRVGIINKHAALLPSCRGVFPYFWAKLYDLPTGVTFHQVNSGIDSGMILAQKPYSAPDREMSLLEFYIDVYNMFPDMALEALNRLLSGQSLPSVFEGDSSYFSFPTYQDYKRFTAQGHWVARVSDLFKKAR